MPLVTLPSLVSTPHAAPSAFALTDEGFDNSGGVSVGLFPTMFIGDLMLAVFTCDALPTTYTLNTPTAGSGGAWTQLFNGTMGTDDQYKCGIWARVATATDFSVVTFTNAGAAFSAACVELYRVPAGSHNVVTPATDITFTTDQGSAAAAATYPAHTVPNSNRLMYLGCYVGNNGNAHTPSPLGGTTLVNYNGATDTSSNLFDVTDQSTPGLKASIPVTFPSANADFKFFSLTYP